MHLVDSVLFYLEPKKFVYSKRGKRILAFWSKIIRKRDGKCLKCGSTIKLEAHHIKQKNSYPQLAFKIWNGGTLCDTCHLKFHSMYGYWGGVREFYEFIRGKRV